MAYGFRVKNSSGEIQIDGNYRNLEYTEGATGVTVANTGTPAGTTISITPSTLIPLILIRPNTDRFVTILHYNRSGGNYINFFITTERTQTTSIDWRCYREIVTASSGYGLRVKDANGNIVFHSASGLFKIVQIDSISLSAPSHPPLTLPSTDITHAGINNPYYILTPVGHYVTDYDESPPGIFIFYGCKIGIKKLNSTSVRVGWFNMINYSIPGAPSGVPEGWNPTVKLITCTI